MIILWKHFSSWVSIFMVWLKITSSWIRKFVDFVFVPNKICWYIIFNVINFTGYQTFEKASILDKWVIELCNRKWNVFIFYFFFFFLHISTLIESEQNQLLNFIIIDQCKSVLFYRIWKFKKNHLQLFYEHVTLAISINIY